MVNNSAQNIVCPKCKSDNVAVNKKTGYVFVISLLLLGLPIPFIKKKYYCFDCENEWKIDFIYYRD